MNYNYYTIKNTEKTHRDNSIKEKGSIMEETYEISGIDSRELDLNGFASVGDLADLFEVAESGVDNN